MVFGFQKSFYMQTEKNVSLDLLLRELSDADVRGQWD